MKQSLLVFLLFLYGHNYNLFAQAIPEAGADIEDDSLNIGGDIFSDFNEELESAQVAEDERYYRYGRFYALNLSGGVTNFSGNRGIYYIAKPPSIQMSVVFFFDFHTAFGMGAAYSQHYMNVNWKTQASSDNLGRIEINLFRSFFFYRYYLDTADLGTAITYSNPYFVGRLEYWYQTRKFVDQPLIQPKTDGAIGFAAGGGLEFPIELKSSYIGIECLYHWITLKDTYDQVYRKDPSKMQGAGDVGIDNLDGNAISIMASIVISW